MPRLERIVAEHPVGNFTCGNPDLDGWLTAAALTSDRAGTARVYIWVDDDETVVGYFAVAPHAFRRDDLPSSVGRGSPTVVPGFLLARLALSESLQGGGMGGELLVHALMTMLDVMRIGGGRVIVVDAIDERAQTFYQHYGFKLVPATEGRLVMKASSVAASLGVGWP